MYDAEGMEYPPSDDDQGRGRSQNNSAQNFYSKESQKKSQNQPTKDLGIKHIQIGILSHLYFSFPFVLLSSLTPTLLINQLSRIFFSTSCKSQRLSLQASK